jgi:hypothetical protein
VSGSGHGRFLACKTDSPPLRGSLAVTGGTGATCYLVHLSCAEALDQVRLVRRRGSPRLHAEVCLHHLLLVRHGRFVAAGGAYLPSSGAAAAP